MPRLATAGKETRRETVVDAADIRRVLGVAARVLRGVGVVADTGVGSARSGGHPGLVARPRVPHCA
ncbi:hypothetical protein PT2222_150204 [Paraburkholderia tropica]